MSLGRSGTRCCNWTCSAIVGLFSFYVLYILRLADPQALVLSPPLFFPFLSPSPLPPPSCLGGLALRGVITPTMQALASWPGNEYVPSPYDSVLMKGEEVGIPSPSSQLRKVRGEYSPLVPTPASYFPSGCLNNFDKGCHPEAPQEEPRPKVGHRHSQELKSRARVSFCLCCFGSLVLSCLGCSLPSLSACPGYVACVGLQQAGHSQAMETS